MRVCVCACMRVCARARHIVCIRVCMSVMERRYRTALIWMDCVTRYVEGGRYEERGTG